MQVYRKPQEAREIEARGRAKDRHARVYAIVPTMHYQAKSQSRPGEVHDIVRTRYGWKCSCPGWCFSGICYAIGQTARRAEREGWSFGKVAPNGQKW